MDSAQTASKPVKSVPDGELHYLEEMMKPDEKPSTKWRKVIGRIVVLVVVLAGVIGGGLWVVQNLVVPAKQEAAKTALFQVAKEFGFEPITFVPAQPGIENSVDSALVKYGSCVFRAVMSEVPLQSTPSQPAKTVNALVVYDGTLQIGADLSVTTMLKKPQYDICAAAPKE